MQQKEKYKDFAKNYNAILKRYVGKNNTEGNHVKLYRELKNYFSIIGLSHIIFTIEKTNNGLMVYYPDQDQRTFIKNLITPQP